MPEIRNQRPRTAQPRLEVVVARQHALPSLQRLADYPAHPARRRLRGLARTHGDGREAQGEAVDVAFARVVVDRVLDHCLLRAVG